MANIIATYLSDGKNRVSFMNSLKIEGRDIVLYSSDNEDFRSSITIPEQPPISVDTVKEPIQRMYNIGELISNEDKMIDCTTIIQEYIDKCYSKGGGVVHLGSGIYKVTSLILRSKVSLVGNNDTIIYRNMEKAPTSYNKDSYNGCYSFIEIPVGAAGCSIKNLTLYGGVNIAATDDTILQVSGITSYTDSYEVNGINILDAPSSVLSNSGNITSSYNLFSSNSIFNDLTLYKYITIENVNIIGFSGSGLVIGTNNTNIIIDKVRSNMNYYSGIIASGNECLFSNIECTGNGNTGIINSGNNNIYNNILIQYSGKYNHNASYGILVSGSGTNIANITLKANWCIGIRVQSNQNIINGLLSDANGGRSSHDPDGGNPNPKDVPQVAITGDSNVIKGIIKNYLATSTIFVASRALECDIGLSNSIIEFLINYNSGENNPYIYDRQIESNMNHEILNNNIITIVKV